LPGSLHFHEPRQKQNSRHLFKEIIHPPDGSYAGFAEQTDYEAGRLISAIKDLGVLDNTLIIFMKLLGEGIIFQNLTPSVTTYLNPRLVVLNEPVSSYDPGFRTRS